MTVTSGPITAAISSDTYGCGKPENGKVQDPLLYVTVDGETRSVSNLRTGEYLITPPQSPNERD